MLELSKFPLSILMKLTNLSSSLRKTRKQDLWLAVPIIAILLSPPYIQYRVYTYIYIIIWYGWLLVPEFGANYYLNSKRASFISIMWAYTIRVPSFEQNRRSSTFCVAGAVARTILFRLRCYQCCHSRYIIHTCTWTKSYKIYVQQKKTYLVGAWTNPLEKICERQKWVNIFPNFRVENSKKNHCNHQPSYAFWNTRIYVPHLYLEVHPSW